jgi:hypothetical protein
MYVTLYQWDVKSGQEQQFIDAWTKVTRHLQSNMPKLSGKLLKSLQGAYIGMVEWPSKEAWEAQTPDTIGLLLQQKLMDTVENVDSLFVMEQIKAINPLS